MILPNDYRQRLFCLRLSSQPILTPLSVQGHDHRFLSFVDEALVNPGSARFQVQRLKHDRRWGRVSIHLRGLPDLAAFDGPGDCGLNLNEPSGYSVTTLL